MLYVPTSAIAVAVTVMRLPERLMAQKEYTSTISNTIGPQAAGYAVVERESTAVSNG